MNPILYLDDSQDRYEAFNNWLSVIYKDYTIQLAKTSKEAIDLLRTGFYSIISLDHDLGVDDTGVAVVDWLCETGFHKITPIVVHSQNIIAVKRMLLKLQDCGFSVFVPSDYNSLLLAAGASLKE